MAEIFLGVIFLVVGFISMIFAAFSGGGAMIILPTLLFAGVGPASSVATTRIGAAAASVTGFFLLKGKLGIGKKIPLFLIVFHSVGAVIGAIILTRVAEGLLFGFVGLILIIGGAITFISKRGGVAIKKNLIKKKSVALAIFLLFLVGIYRGFFGPASGTINRLIFVNVLKLSHIQSLAISNHLTLVASVFSALVFLYAGLINFGIGFWLVIGAPIGAFVGIKTVLAKGNLWVSKVFGVIAVAIGFYLIVLR